MPPEEVEDPSLGWAEHDRALAEFRATLSPDELEHERILMISPSTKRKRGKRASV